MNKTIMFIFILIFLTYPFDSFQLFEFIGYGFKPTDLALMMLIIYYFKRVLWNGDALRLHIKPHIALFIAFIVSIIVSAIYPILWGNAFAIMQFVKTTLHLFFILLIIPSVLTLDIKPIHWVRSFESILIFSLFINIFGIYQIFARAFDLPFAWLKINNVALKARGVIDMDQVTQLSLQFEKFFRATSIFSEPSMLASFNTICLTLMIVPFVLRKPQFVRNNWLAIAVFAMLLIGTLATFSLTAMVSLFGVIVAVLAFEGKRFIKHSSIIILVSASLIFLGDSQFEKHLGTSVVKLFSERVNGIIGMAKNNEKVVAGESAIFRKMQIDESIRLWKKSPVFGVGIGNFYLISSKKFIQYSQDMFFGSLAELGIIGMISITSMFLALLFKLRKIIKSENPDSEHAYLYNVAFYILLNNFIVNYSSSNYMIFLNLWLYIAFVFYMINFYYISKNEPCKEYKLFARPLKQYFLMK